MRQSVDAPCIACIARVDDVPWHEMREVKCTMNFPSHHGIDWFHQSPTAAVGTSHASSVAGCAGGAQSHATCQVSLAERAPPICGRAYTEI
eukprot:scaffold432313_cov19-Prasinocladus_malaysianus.AAC.1